MSASYLSLLANQTAVAIMDRQRLISLSLEPTIEEDKNIRKNLEELRQGISALEVNSVRSKNDKPGIKKNIKDLHTQYETLAEKFYGDDFELYSIPHVDESIRGNINSNGNTNANSNSNLNAIKRKINTNTNTNINIRNKLNSNNDIQLSNQLGKNNTSIEPSSQKLSKSVRFSDNLVNYVQPYSDTDLDDNLGLNGDYGNNSNNIDGDDNFESSNNSILMKHKQTISEQDESLDRLSVSIRNQQQLSMQIGDELDSHVQILDDLEALTDRSSNNLNSARKRLDKYSKKFKEHGSLLTIGILILILLILIIVLK